MNYCELTKKIQVNPHKSMTEQLGRPMKVRDMLEFQQHVAECISCQDIIDEVNSQNPKQEEFYKGELN